MFEILSVCKGGGYRYCRTNPPHPKANSKGLYPLHRVLVENKIGRLLRSDEVVHHKDENKENDSPDNLELLSRGEHTRLHRPMSARVECLCECGKAFSLRPHAYRQRQKRSRSPLYCSLKCKAEAARRKNRQVA